MLQFAKTESKKEMSLKKHKKMNNIPIYTNKNLNMRNDFQPNFIQSENQVKHKLIKKTNILNKNNNSNKKIPKQFSGILSKDKNNIYSPLSVSQNNKTKKIISLNNNCLNTIYSKKCESVRNKRKTNNNNIYNFNNMLNFQKEKRSDSLENKLLKTIVNGRVRKLISMSSDIFNLNDTATNLYRRITLSPRSPNFYKIINKNDNQDNSKNSKNNLNAFSANNKNKKNYIKYHRINVFNRSQYNPNVTNFFNSSGKKTNRTNIESVKYDIITTKKNNLYDKYNDLSGIKASSSMVEDYEILMPKNYSKTNIQNLKNTFASNGIHFFGLKEEGDLIGGIKGMFKMKVRTNGQNEKDKNKIINKVSKKLLNYDVKLKKNIIDHGRKKTDITGYRW